MKNSYHLVIMAGGIGSRFWPMSTEAMPKQFIDVLGVGRSLLQLTYDRFKNVCPPENIWVVTNANYVDIVAEQLPEIPRKNILSELCRRNTAPCIAYVSWRIKMQDPVANIVVSPSDHVVINVPEFQRVINNALQFASETDAIVTLGMKPNRPETGFGYIKADMAQQSPRNAEMFSVESFREKPDLETAQEYIKHSCYFWNAGIFIWNISTIINAFRMYHPQISRVFESMQNVLGTDKEQEVINSRYAECDNISVDYAILEKADEIFVQPADFGWSDLGTWGTLHQLSNKDDDNNALISSNVKTYESKNNIINVEGAKQVVVQGLDGYIVAERDGRLLICKLSEEQRIKQFAES